MGIIETLDSSHTLDKISKIPPRINIRNYYNNFVY